VSDTVITTATPYVMCADSSSDAPTGILYDSGGPVGSYRNDEDCTFLIEPAGATTVTLHFYYFDTAGSSDYLSVYDGTDATAPLLGTYSRGDAPPTVAATSGAAYLAWHSSHDDREPGFEIDWTSQ